GLGVVPRRHDARLRVSRDRGGRADGARRPSPEAVRDAASALHRSPRGARRVRPFVVTISPAPPRAPFQLPWDDAAAPAPVVALAAARTELGDTFVVESGGVEYLFVFGAAGLRAFYSLAERDASKGLADYRMLVRKLPIELFAERRTFAHDLFGRQEVEGY